MAIGKLRNIVFVGSVLVGTAVAGQSALADGWPNSVSGTWALNANGTTGTLVITQAAEPVKCKPLSGTLLSQPITGFYCPASGRIVFMVGGSILGLAKQVYSGNLSQATAAPKFMSGSFSVTDTAGLHSLLGEYGFYATK